MSDVVSRETDEEGQLEIEQAEAERFALIEREALKFTLRTYEGRWFIWRLLEKTGVYATSFRGEAPLTMAHCEGKREIGLWTLQECLTANPEIYTLMRTENVSREDERKKRVSNG